MVLAKVYVVVPEDAATAAVIVCNTDHAFVTFNNTGEPFTVGVSKYVTDPKTSVVIY